MSSHGSNNEKVNTGSTWGERAKIQEMIGKGNFETKECGLCHGRLAHCVRCRGYGVVPKHGEWKHYF